MRVASSASYHTFAEWTKQLCHLLCAGDAERLQVAELQMHGSSSVGYQQNNAAGAILQSASLPYLSRVLSCIKQQWPIQLLSHQTVVGHTVLHSAAPFQVGLCTVPHMSAWRCASSYAWLIQVPVHHRLFSVASLPTGVKWESAHEARNECGLQAGSPQAQAHLPGLGKTCLQLRSCLSPCPQSLWTSTLRLSLTGGPALHLAARPALTRLLWSCDPAETHVIQALWQEGDPKLQRVSIGSVGCKAGCADIRLDYLHGFLMVQTCICRSSQQVMDVCLWKWQFV